ncbi:uncharacterized protein [Rutidosis leptorrhynchoides]|uniref:uncharacterized protein n=1 Tax=Rutidosis leptorrhynchoides TaxID=125765 RepID=UPI003A98FC9B
MGHKAAECRGKVKCFYCSKEGHIMAECPEYKKDESEGVDRKVIKRKLGAGDIKPRPHVYQITTDEVKESHDIVTDIFIVNHMPPNVLIDCGASRSFVSTQFCKDLNVPVSKLEHPLDVEVANDMTVRVTEVYKGCTMVINNEEFFIDLIPMQMGEFHVIVGMDWLGDNEGYINCLKKIIHMNAPNGRVVTIYGSTRRQPIPLCTYETAKRFLAHGCQSFLAHVVDKTKSANSIDEVRIVNEFKDVFSKELPGVPPEREVKFHIDLIPGDTSIAKTPYRLAPFEMKEMMTQIQELLDKGFIRPSSSP